MVTGELDKQSIEDVNVEAANALIHQPKKAPFLINTEQNRTHSGEFKTASPILEQ